MSRSPAFTATSVVSASVTELKRAAELLNLLFDGAKALAVEKKRAGNRADENSFPVHYEAHGIALSKALNEHLNLHLKQTPCCLPVK